MLWAWEPVKCWSRLPKAAGGTIRRSTEMPLWVCARRPLSLGLPAAATSAWPARNSASSFGSSAVAMMSMSLLVSAQRRTEPATSTRCAPGCSRRAAASSSAIGRTVESRRRPGPSPGSADALERGEHVHLGFRPEAFDVADLLLFRRFLQVLERGDLQFLPEQARGFRPDPGDPRHLDQGRREFRFQLRRGGDFAGVEQGVDLFGERLADAGDLGRAPGPRQLLDRDRAFADRLGGGRVGEDAVADRAVKLVQDPEFLQRGGDVSVRHRGEINDLTFQSHA